MGTINSKITRTKEKERRKMKNEEGERRRGEKKAMVALLAFVMAAFEKNCWTLKVYLAVTFSKILPKVRA